MENPRVWLEKKPRAGQRMMDEWLMVEQSLNGSLECRDLERRRWCVW